MARVLRVDHGVADHIQIVEGATFDERAFTKHHAPPKARELGNGSGDYGAYNSRTTSAMRGLLCSAV